MVGPMRVFQIPGVGLLELTLEPNQIGVCLDGRPLALCRDVDTIEAGGVVRLPDGSKLSVQRQIEFDELSGLNLQKWIVLRNGEPIPAQHELNPMLFALNKGIKGGTI